MATGSDPFTTPGFRFYPTEEELLSFYLRHRLAGTRPDVERVIPVVDIYSYHPRDLRSLAGAANVSDTEQWFFCCPRAERELHGGRPARTTPSGYWKATGSPSYVFSSSADRIIGEKRTMVFYQGRAPTGNKTRWKMNEYKAVADPDPAAAAAAEIRLRNEFSVCRVYISTGTLRSFDRRPLNAAGRVQAVLHHHHHHHHVLPPSANANQLAAEVVANGQTENSHDSSSSGSRGVVVDGTDDAAIDWDSIITPADGLSFSVDDFTRAIWPQI